jgi:hypothetical protein
MQEVEYLPQPELLQTFLELNYYIFYDQDDKALSLLASLQRNIDALKVSQYSVLKELYFNVYIVWR